MRKHLFQPCCKTKYVLAMPGETDPRKGAMTIRLFILICAMLLAITLDAGAGEPVMRTDEILAQQHAIRAEMDARTGRYLDMSRSKQETILADQKKLAALLDGKTDTSQLDPVEQGEVFTLVAGIKAAINDTDDDRLICTREARTGSNYMTRVCRTPAQVRKQKEAAEKLLKEETSRMKCTDANGCV